MTFENTFPDGPYSYLGLTSTVLVLIIFYFQNLGENGASRPLKLFYFFHGPMSNYIKLILKTLKSM